MNTSWRRTTLPRLGAFPNLRLVSMVPALGRFRLSFTDRSPAAPLAGGALAFTGRGMSALADAFELTRALVALETPTGSEGPATDLLERRLVAARATAPCASRSRPGRDNLLAFREPPALVFSTHVDCVPPYVPLAEDAESIHGRGSCDAKGLAAAMVAAAERLARRGERRIGLLFLVGEENGSDGARVAADLEPRGRFLINGEPTENRLSIGQKGSLRVDLRATGPRRALGLSRRGRVSAIAAAARHASSGSGACPSPSDPLLGASTLNIGLIQGGVAPNVHRRPTRQASS